MRWKIWVGMDLGKRFHQVAVINGTLDLVMPSFRVGRGRAGVEKLLRVVKNLGIGAPDVVVTIEFSDTTRRREYIHKLLRKNQLY